MLWILNSSRNFFPLSMRAGKLCFPLVALFLSASALLLPLPSLAEDDLTRTNDLYFARDPAVASAVTNLSLALAASTGTRDVDYAQQIWNLLNATVAAGYFMTFPFMWPNGMSIGEYLAYAGGWPAVYGSQDDTLRSLLLDIRANSNAWNRADILSLQSAISANSNVWTRADIQSVLSAIPSNVWTSSDVQSILSDIYDISQNSSSSATSLYNIDDRLYGLDSLLQNWGYWFSDWNDEFQAYNSRFPVFTWMSSDDQSFFENLFADVTDGLEDLGETIVNNLVGEWNTWHGDSASVMTGIWEQVQAVVDGVDDVNDLLRSATNRTDQYWEHLFRHELGYYDESTRTVARDLRFLQQQLGVENPNQTNNLFALLKGLFVSPEDVASATALTNQFATALSQSRESQERADSADQSNILAVASEDMDYEDRDQTYTGTNPYDTLANLSGSAETQFNAILGGLNPQTESTITLFRGAFPIYGGQSTRSGSSVNLDISYALRDNDEVSIGLGTMSTIMETVWDIVAVLLMAWMYFRFYQDISSGNFEKF